METYTFKLRVKYLRGKRIWKNYYNPEDHFLAVTGWAILSVVVVGAVISLVYNIYLHV